MYCSTLSLSTMPTVEKDNYVVPVIAAQEQPIMLELQQRLESEKETNILKPRLQQPEAFSTPWALVTAQVAGVDYLTKIPKTASLSIKLWLHNAKMVADNACPQMNTGRVTDLFLDGT